MGSRTWIALVAAAVAAEVVVAGCGGGSKSHPTIASVTPSLWNHGQPQSITVIGGGFLVKVTPNADKPDGSQITSAPYLRISSDVGDPKILPTTYWSSSALTATVSSSLAAAFYDLTVVNPDGATATLAHGILINGPIALVIGSAQEAFPATVSSSDVVTLPFTIVDGFGSPIGIDTSPASVTLARSSTAATFVTTSSLSLAVGTSSGSLTLHDGRAETVAVYGSSSTLAVTPGHATFIVGPPHFVHLLDASNQNPAPGANDAFTHARVEDVDGNPASLAPAVSFSSNFVEDPADSGNICCQAYVYSGGPITIVAGGTTSNTVSTHCGTGPGGACAIPYSYTIIPSGETTTTGLVKKHGTISGNTNP